MNIYGYGCYPASSKDPFRSTIYKSLRGQFLPKENIFLDRMGSREELYLLLSNCLEEDTIVAINKRTFGTTNEFRQLWKEIVLDRKVNLLIVDENAEERIDYYSTCDYAFKRFEEDVVDEKWQKLQNDVFERQTTKIGRKNAVLTSRFKEVYWYYQSFWIKVDEAYTNLGISKPTFYALSKEYELTEEYVEELRKRTQLHCIAKRGGVTKEIELLLLNVERMGMTLEDACNQIGIPALSDIEYKRYKLAKEGGRKELFRLEAENYRPDFLKDH